MRFDQAGCDQTAASVDDAGVRSGQRANCFVTADGKDATALDCNGLGVRQCWIGREHLGIDQQHLRFGERGRADKEHRNNPGTSRKAANPAIDRRHPHEIPPLARVGAVLV